MSNIEIFRNGLKEFEIDYNDETIEKFKVYKELLKEWNEKINLTAITDDNEIDIKHFLDSITVLKTGYIKSGQKIIDVGTGGGFPGVPIKIMEEGTDVVLLDSLNKRINFLNEVISNLGLKNIKAIHGRAEDFGLNSEYREKFDVVVSRAVASLNILSEYCLPFVKVGGHFIALKGPEIKNEMEESKKALKILGAEIVDKIDITLPSSDITHILLVMRKVQKTPTKYPRKAGMPKKNPL